LQRKRGEGRAGSRLRHHIQKTKGAAMANEAITLEFLAKQQRQIIDELVAMRTQFSVMQDDIRVLSAMAMRQDNSTKSFLDLIQRHDQRIRELEQTP
jgi:hypothetical protein